MSNITKVNRTPMEFLLAADEQEFRVAKKFVWLLDGPLRYAPDNRRSLSSQKRLRWSKTVAKDFGVGRKIDSGEVNVTLGDITTKWGLIFCPAGDRKQDNTGRSSLFLQLKEASSLNFTAKFDLGVVARSGGKESHVRYAHIVQHDHLKIGNGFPRLISHQQLFDPANGFIVDGKIELFCNLILTRTDTTTVQATNSLGDTLATNFLRMFDEELLTDFEIITSDHQTIKVHKTILAARSPVFLAMLTSDLEETNTGQVTIKDVNAATMRELLRFVYGNEIENLANTARDLVIAADKYHIEQLKRICLSSITLSLSSANVFEILEIAGSVTNTGVLDLCFDILFMNFEDLSKTDDFKNLPQDLVMEFAKYSVRNPSTVYV